MWLGDEGVSTGDEFPASDMKPVNFSPVAMSTQSEFKSVLLLGVAIVWSAILFKMGVDFDCLGFEFKLFVKYFEFTFKIWGSLAEILCSDDSKTRGSFKL